MESQICLKEYESTGNSGLGQLEAHLQILMAGRVRHFHLIATDLGLVLRGQTRTYYAKQLAQHAVMEATDLPIVANEIAVF